ncbi:trigger factor [Clostridium uliginosum]|uniref:Trigger factor n=1 Tax=Clostridium uliginosum TaxID=119641 RepID=A0A1I1LWT1_9CLOT|nr:trigger factor [Clostridium uliginosum]SFC77435.1 trigger factor [Clostridium uliginosum]
MEAKVEKIETNVVKLEIRVEAEKFDAALTKAYNKNKGRYNIPGFRKGKVPMAMVKKFYGVEVFYDEAINFAIDASYPAALQEQNIRPVDQPQVDIVELGEGKELVYTATVTTYPTVELGEYKGLDIKKPSYEVVEEEIEKQIKEAQEKNARIETKESGKIAKGDIAVIDFKGYIDGTAFEGGEGNDYPLEIGSGTFIDDFEDQLIDLEIGTKKEVKVSFPENYGKEELNGKPAMFEVTIKGIKAKELPELDDEFAKEVSEFDTFAEYKESIKKNLADANEARAEREFEEAVITSIIETSKMELPEVMLTKEIDNMMKDLEGRLQYQGLSLDQYMEFTGNTTEKMRDFMKENAERKVKADIILEEVAKAENVKATEEQLNVRALELGKIYGPKDPKKMANILIRSQKAMIERDIVIENTLKLLKESCK